MAEHLPLNEAHERRLLSNARHADLPTRLAYKAVPRPGSGRLMSPGRVPPRQKMPPTTRGLPGGSRSLPAQGATVV